MKWLKELWNKYMAGAKANNFPIWEYGLLGGKYKKTKTMKEGKNGR